MYYGKPAAGGPDSRHELHFANSQYRIMVIGLYSQKWIATDESVYKTSNRAATNTPICVGMISAGKFGSMFLAQAIKLPGIHIVAICDIDVGRPNPTRLHWLASRPIRRHVTNDALKHHSTFLTDHSDA